MKKYLIQSLRLTLVLLLLLCVIYPVLLAFAAKLSKGGGNGEKIMLKGKVVGYANIGQTFSQPTYFWGRPSAVGYDAAGSGGSNKGPSNEENNRLIAARIDALIKYHPYLKRSEIPADLVTASASGLDPNISPQAARIQVKRVAAARNLSEQEVSALVDMHTEKPAMGLLGPSKVNVLKLNVALEQVK